MGHETERLGLATITRTRMIRFATVPTAKPLALPHTKHTIVLTLYRYSAAKGGSYFEYYTAVKLNSIYRYCYSTTDEQTIGSAKGAWWARDSGGTSNNSHSTALGADRTLWWDKYALLLIIRGTILKRTYGTHKILYKYQFLLTIFGPIYYGPP